MNDIFKDIDELKAPSEYMKEVLATPPSWIVRWGELFVLLFVMAIFLLSWLIQYPDRIPAQVMITTENPPIAVIARADGPLAELFVHDHESVKVGQVLAIIQNPAKYKDVLALKDQVDKFDIEALANPFKESYHLGSLQQLYGQLQNHTDQYHLYIKHTPHYHEQLAVGKQIERYRHLLEQKEGHLEILERKIQLAQKDYQRNESLHNSEIIADKAFEDSESKMLEMLEAYETQKSEELNVKVQVAELERVWHQLATKHSLEGEELRAGMITALDNMRSAITHWEENYLIIAPRAGKVSFSDFWTEQQYIESGQQILSIVPDKLLDGKEQEVIGQLRVPVQNSGKLALGQRVRVYLKNYPSHEFGAVNGIIQDISSLPKKGSYNLIITFPEGLKTQYGKIIPFQQQLQGRAEVITNDISLIERIFFTLKSTLSEFNV